MGRKLNISQPVVINTELSALDESIEIQASGQLEQWYYDNNTLYAPNRLVTPLVLSVGISVMDLDSKITYTPTIYTVHWYTEEWDETNQEYVKTEVSATQDGNNVLYYKNSQHGLVVKKNVSYSHAVNIYAEVVYIDPRDPGVTYSATDQVTLTTNKDATVVWPEVAIISPSSRGFNPLVDSSSTFTFEATTTNHPQLNENLDYITRFNAYECGGSETIEPNEGDITPVLDIRYGSRPEQTNQQFYYRVTGGEQYNDINNEVAYVTKVSGDTVVENQLVSNAAAVNGLMLWLNVEGSDGEHEQFTNDYIEHISISFTQYSDTYIDIMEGRSNLDDENFYDTVFTAEEDDVFSISILGDGFLNEEPISLYDLGDPWLADSDGALEPDVNLIAGHKYFIHAYLNSRLLDNNFKLYVNLVDLNVFYGYDPGEITAEEFNVDYYHKFGYRYCFRRYDAGTLRSASINKVRVTGQNFVNLDLIQFNKEIVADTGISERNNYVICKIPYIYDNGCRYVRYKRNNNGNTLSSSGKVTLANLGRYNDVTGWKKFASNAATASCTIHTMYMYVSAQRPYMLNENRIGGVVLNDLYGSTTNPLTWLYNNHIFPLHNIKLNRIGDVKDEIYLQDGKIYYKQKIMEMSAYDVAKEFTYDSNSGLLYDALHTAGTFTDGLVVICSDSKYQQLDDVDVPQDNYCIGISNGKLCLYNPDVYTKDDFVESLKNVKILIVKATPTTTQKDIPDSYRVAYSWYAVNSDGTETLAENALWYRSGQDTNTMTVDALYGDPVNVVCRAKFKDIGTLSPSKSFATIQWRTPDIDVSVISHNGGAVRSTTRDMKFSPIVNVRHAALSDSVIDANLRFNWKYRKSNSSTENQIGWGHDVTIDGSILMNSQGTVENGQTVVTTLASSLVYADVYLLGAYEKVLNSSDSAEITQDDETVVYRSLETQ